MNMPSLGLSDPRASHTLSAARAISHLVDTARATRDNAVAKRRRLIAHRCQIIADQLDATRTRLVQDGDEYIDTAWAYVDAARVALRNYRMVVG